MRIQRVTAKQAHYTPDHAYYARGVFDPEITTDPKIIHEYVSQSDGDGVEMPIGSTSQNNFKELNWFRCNGCNTILSEHHVSEHLDCVVPEYEEDNG